MIRREGPPSIEITVLAFLVEKVQGGFSVVYSLKTSE